MERGVEAPGLRAFVEPVPVDQPFLAEAGLDPVGAEEIVAFDVVGVAVVEEAVHVFGRLDRHALAGQEIEMRCTREGLGSGADGREGGVDEAPFAPAAAFARREDDPRVRGESRFQGLEVRPGRVRIEMDGNRVACGRQAFGLGHNRLHILVAQENIGDLGHLPPGSCCPLPLPDRSSANRRIEGTLEFCFFLRKHRQ